MSKYGLTVSGTVICMTINPKTEIVAIMFDTYWDENTPYYNIPYNIFIISYYIKEHIALLYL